MLKALEEGFTVILVEVSHVLYPGGKMTTLTAFATGSRFPPPEGSVFVLFRPHLGNVMFRS